MSYAAATVPSCDGGGRGSLARCSSRPSWAGPGAAGEDPRGVQGLCPVARRLARRRRPHRADQGVDRPGDRGGGSLRRMHRLARQGSGPQRCHPRGGRRGARGHPDDGRRAGDRVRPARLGGVSGVPRRETRVIFASIPSPSFNQFHLGPLTLHVYGITMGLAVATGWWLTVRRYQRLGGDPAVAERAVFWTVVIGFTGARFAYVSTHWYRFTDDWLGVFKIWEGGIAMFGGLTAGSLAAVWLIRRSGATFPTFADAAAVGLPAAQAIGRWGNYFNQELFGTPTTVPWALRIDPSNPPVG